MTKLEKELLQKSILLSTYSTTLRKIFNYELLLLGKHLSVEVDPFKSQEENMRLILSQHPELSEMEDDLIFFRKRKNIKTNQEHLELVLPEEVRTSKYVYAERRIGNTDACDVKELMCRMKDEDSTEESDPAQEHLMNITNELAALVCQVQDILEKIDLKALVCQVQDIMEKIYQNQKDSLLLIKSHQNSNRLRNGLQGHCIRFMFNDCAKKDCKFKHVPSTDIPRHVYKFGKSIYKPRVKPRKKTRLVTKDLNWPPNGAVVIDLKQSEKTKTTQNL